MDRGQKAKVAKTYTTTEGTLYKDSVVRIENTSTKSTTIRVKDNIGKIYYINSKDIILL